MPGGMPSGDPDFEGVCIVAMGLLRRHSPALPPIGERAQSGFACLARSLSAKTRQTWVGLRIVRLATCET